MAYLDTLSRHSPGDTEENPEI